MKSVNFKRRGTEIRTLPEETRTSRRKWDRITYVFILIILLAFGIYYASTKLLYTRAQGQVMYENVDIRLLSNCRITKYFVHEYDSVRVGDTLFEYIDDKDDAVKKSITEIYEGEGGGGGGSDNSGLQRDVQSKRDKISSLEAKRKENLSLINSFEAELERIRASVILGVLPQSRLDIRQNEITHLKAENIRLTEEISEARKSLGSIRAELGNSNQSGGSNSKTVIISEVPLTSDNSGLAELEKKKKYFISPINGSINRIYTLEFETALRDEVVLAIHKKSPIFIRSYFEQEDLAQVAIGEEFTVTFPDGTVSKGILKSFYYSTIPLPEEFQKQYEPISRSIVGDIYPANREEADLWKNFYKMSVDVSQSKY